MSKTLKLILMLVSLISISTACRAANLGYFLGAGRTMWQGDYLTSQNGRYMLSMQTDGSLVLYRIADGKVLYSMAKHGQFATMQTDGNFVEYDSGGNWLWATHTDVSTGEVRIAMLQNDGSFVISCLGPSYIFYWNSGADPDYLTSGAQRYPLTVTNLGTPPAAPSGSPAADYYYATPGQQIIQ